MSSSNKLSIIGAFQTLYFADYNGFRGLQFQYVRGCNDALCWFNRTKDDNIWKLSSIRQVNMSLFTSVNGGHWFSWIGEKDSNLSIIPMKAISYADLP